MASKAMVSFGEHHQACVIEVIMYSFFELGRMRKGIGHCQK